jgi:hypothetical protein
MARKEEFAKAYAEHEAIHLDESGVEGFSAGGLFWWEACRAIDHVAAHLGIPLEHEYAYPDDAMEMISGRLGLPENHDIVQLAHEELHRAAAQLTVRITAAPTNDPAAIRPQDRWDVRVTWAR